MKNETAITTLLFKFDVYFNYRGVVRYENQNVDDYIIGLTDRIRTFGGHNFQEIAKEKVLQDWKSEGVFDQLLNLPAYNSRNRNFERSSLDELVNIWNYVESVNGVHQLFEASESAPNLDAQRKNPEHCLQERANGVQNSSSRKDDSGGMHEKDIEPRIPIKHVKISANSKGHGYESLFGSYLTNNVTGIRIDEPYLIEFYQIQNFLRFCELALKKCPTLSEIKVKTRRDPIDESDQIKRLEELRSTLADNRVCLEIEFSETVHDRQIL
ncbi:hypothetical protein QAD02_012320 [Eretmocerus hayati]|uniref:Uncharacterized protein n=1 Tax=Eretmocerus hayati TaxID=131215 RepID=A0ACC2P092_9HYME|nr:hypothetical protein QAD02_012320 [Eretmocerus hayati]